MGRTKYLSRNICPTYRNDRVLLGPGSVSDRKTPVLMPFPALFAPSGFASIICRAYFYPGVFLRARFFALASHHWPAALSAASIWRSGHERGRC